MAWEVRKISKKQGILKLSPPFILWAGKEEGSILGQVLLGLLDHWTRTFLPLRCLGDSETKVPEALLLISGFGDFNNPHA